MLSHKHIRSSALYMNTVHTHLSHTHTLHRHTTHTLHTYTSTHTHPTHKNQYMKLIKNQAWWYISTIPQFRKQRQEVTNLSQAWVAQLHLGFLILMHCIEFQWRRIQLVWEQSDQEEGLNVWCQNVTFASSESLSLLNVKFHDKTQRRRSRPCIATVG